MPMTSELACSTATKTLARPSRMVIVCVMSVPHISLTLSVMIVPSCGLASVRPTRLARASRSHASPVAHGAARAHAHNSKQRRARVPRSSSRPPGGQRAFALQRLDLGVEQLVAHGDLAHLGFQPGDLVVAVIAFAFFQCS